MPAVAPAATSVVAPLSIAGRTAAQPITAERLTLEPLRIEHATEMAEVLSGAGLYTFIGGTAPTVPELLAKYARQARGVSPAGDQLWLNWIVRTVEPDEAVGYVQATVELRGGLVADIAWVIGEAHQGRGFAREAAAVMRDWLVSRGVAELISHIHPGNTASERVAAGLGLSQTRKLLDGERVWTTQPPA